jgi:polysaccharide biosynthesis/export protein
LGIAVARQLKLISYTSIINQRDHDDRNTSCQLYTRRALSYATGFFGEVTTMILKQWFHILLLVLATASALGAHAQDNQAEYRLGDGDNIRITVFQNPDLSLDTRVSENGLISFPLIGSVKVGGLTIPAASAAIANALRSGGFIQNPQVNINLTKNLGHQVSLLGGVGKPGRYPLETFNTRLSEILAMAGGIGPNGADIAIVTGTRNGKPFRKKIDIPGMFLDDKQDDILVAGGDVIYVPDAPKFSIYGEIQRPGAYRIERNMTVRQALAVAGGVTQRGTLRDMTVFRRGADGGTTSSGVAMDDLVRPDDVYQLKESLF